MNGLRLGRLDRRTLFVCIDMQRLFLEPGDWFCAAGLEILPEVVAISDQVGLSCCFTRFITPQRADLATGQWQPYYRHWRSVTGERAGAAVLDLHADLRQRPGRVFDKTTHDAFGSLAFTQYVETGKPSALVLFGIESDVCVLATALSAVDLGIRVVIVADAIASSVPAAHDACLRYIYPRFDQQLEVANHRTVLNAWEGPRGADWTAAPTSTA